MKCDLLSKRSSARRASHRKQMQEHPHAGITTFPSRRSKRWRGIVTNCKINESLGTGS